mmetsp:Transcript_15309/g.23262  ORF Transcript_15309/g.23262 Transcript_15309/m.23262 type:complete len:643 (+) Transcript_15309:77-2005(+)
MGANIVVWVWVILVTGTMEWVQSTTEYIFQFDLKNEKDWDDYQVVHGDDAVQGTSHKCTQRIPKIFKRLCVAFDDAKGFKLDFQNAPNVNAEHESTYSDLLWYYGDHESAQNAEKVAQAKYVDFDAQVKHVEIVPSFGLRRGLLSPEQKSKLAKLLDARKCFEYGGAKACAHVDPSHSHLMTVSVGLEDDDEESGHEFAALLEDDDALLEEEDELYDEDDIDDLLYADDMDDMDDADIAIDAEIQVQKLKLATFEEDSASALHSIQSQLAASDENGRILSRHESQNSMLAIMDFIRTTKSTISMQSQSLDLEMIADALSGDDDDGHEQQNVEQDEEEEEVQREHAALLNESSFLSQSADDSFSDHLGHIEDLLNENRNELMQTPPSSTDHKTKSPSKSFSKSPTKSSSKSPKKSKPKPKSKPVEERLLMDDSSDMRDSLDSMEDEYTDKMRLPSPKTGLTLVNSHSDFSQNDAKNGQFLATPNGSNIDANMSASTSMTTVNASTDDEDEDEEDDDDDDDDEEDDDDDDVEEPPMFWTVNNTFHADRLQQIMSDPEQLLDNVLSPQRGAMMDDGDLSDWDKSSTASEPQTLQLNIPKTKFDNNKNGSKNRKPASAKTATTNASDKKRGSQKLNQNDLKQFQQK